MTKREMFGVVRSIVENANISLQEKDDIFTFIDHEVELLNKKKESTSLSKVQKENLLIMDTICNSLVEVGKPVTITELQAVDANMAIYSNQKLSSLLRKLVTEGKVVKVVEKKKAYFSIPTE